MLDELGATDPRRIGPYEIEGVLGSGGMGRVFLGRAADGTRAAVKLIRTDLAQNPEFTTRLAREVAAGRRITGRGVVPVVDADVEAVPPWMATEYVPAPSLYARVTAEGPLAAHEVRLLGTALAATLAEVHAADLVHRDVKPSNVLLADDGPKLIDFGIARDAAASTMTQPGFVMGTPEHMSPEQIKSLRDQVGPPTDVFALGGVLAFAATGRLPFGIGDRTALAYRIVHMAPDLDGIPPELLGIINRCLAKQPEERPTAAEVAAELREPATHVSEGDGAALELPPSGPESEAPKDPSAPETPATSDPPASGLGSVVSEPPADDPIDQHPADIGQDSEDTAHPSSGRPTTDPTTRPRGKNRRRAALVGSGVVAILIATIAILADGSAGGAHGATDHPVAVPGVSTRSGASSSSTPSANAGSGTPSGTTAPNPPGPAPSTSTPSGPGTSPNHGASSAVVPQPSSYTTAPQPAPSTTPPRPPGTTTSAGCTQTSAPCRTTSGGVHFVELNDVGGTTCLTLYKNMGSVLLTAYCSGSDKLWQVWHGSTSGSIQLESNISAGQCVTSGSTNAAVAPCSPTDPKQWLVLAPTSGGYLLESYADQTCLAGPYAQWDPCNSGRSQVWTIP